MTAALLRVLWAFQMPGDSWDMLAMKIITTCLLAAFLQHSVHAAGRPAPLSRSPNPNTILERLEGLLDGLANDTDMILMQLTGLSTQTASTGGQLQQLSDLFLPAAEMQNAQQDSLTNTYKDQIKSIRHKVGAAIAKTAEASDLATSTSLDTDELLEKLNNDLTDINLSQNVDIDNLHRGAKELAGKADQQVQQALGTLRDDLTSTGAVVQGLMGRINSRKCEYGSGAFQEGNTTISFDKIFTQNPNVMLSMAGFDAHMAQPANSPKDGLGFDQYVTSVTTTSFTINVHSLTGGSAILHRVYSNWMACQN